MSEKPKGQGFGLPEDLIRALDKVAVKEEVVEEAAEEVKWERSKNKSPEDVEKRVGGANQRKKAAQALAAADEADGFIEQNKKLETDDAKEQLRLKRELKRKTLKEVDFSDPDEIQVEVPAIYEDEVQEEKKVNRRKNSKKQTEVAEDAQTTVLDGVELDFSDPEIESKTLKTKDVLAATSIDDLLEKVDASEGIQGKSDYFNKVDLRRIIEGVRDGELDYNYITRMGGLRKKVYDLLNPVEEVVKEEKPYLLEEEPIKPAETADVNFEHPFLKEFKELPKISETTDVSETSELPEVPLPEVKVGKPKFIVEWEVEKMEQDLDEKRSKFIEAHKTLEKKNAIAKNLLKKFAYRIKTGKPLNLAEEKDANEKARKEYQKSLNSLVGVLEKKKLDEILHAGPDSEEVKEYEYVTISQVKAFSEDKVKKQEKGDRTKIKDYFDIYLKLQIEFPNNKPIPFSELVKKNLFTKGEMEKKRAELLKQSISRKIKQDLIDSEREKLVYF